MKRGEGKQLHNKTQDELQVLLREVRSAFFKAKMDLTQNKLKNPHTLRERRWDIARILTVMKMREKEKKNA